MLIYADKRMFNRVTPIYTPIKLCLGDIIRIQTLYQHVSVLIALGTIICHTCFKKVRFESMWRLNNYGIILHEADVNCVTTRAFYNVTWVNLHKKCFLHIQASIDTIFQFSS